MMDRVTDALSSRVAIYAIPVVCVALRAVGFADEALTFALSVLALTFSQLVLRAGNTDTSAIQAKLDELVRVTDAADDRLIALERRR